MFVCLNIIFSTKISGVIGFPILIDLKSNLIQVLLYLCLISKIMVKSYVIDSIFLC